MIVVVHNHDKVIQVVEVSHQQKIVFNEKETIFEVLQQLAEKYPSSIIGWCTEKYFPYLNIEKWSTIFHHHLIFASYSPQISNFEKYIGYVDQSVFINVKKQGVYPTWLAATEVGGMHASVLNQIPQLSRYSFHFCLNYVTKTLQSQGLLCYSNEQLLQKGYDQTFQAEIMTKSEMLFFIKSCYKKLWYFVFLGMLLIYEKKFWIIAILRTMFKPVFKSVFSLSNILVKSQQPNCLKNDFSVDVVIPTLGRKLYLYDVLKDLSKQTILPKKVIIVEQNADENSVSELDYLKENWPFEIDHTFIHQLGACNARNIALSKVTANWVFFADDDIRFDKDLLAQSLQYINQYGVEVIGLSCLQKGEKEIDQIIKQSYHFGSGTSMVKRECLINVTFKNEHELGYGEDMDFGMQLRNKGVDIIFFPMLQMLHLKAPLGGFRAPVSKPWEKEEVTPKPSPTVMAYQLKHATQAQQLTYQWLLWLKFYKHQPIKNPFKYVREMNRKWNQSIFWAQKLMQHEI